MLQELEFLWKIDSTPRDSNCVVSKSNSNSTSQLYLDFQHNLEQYLRIWREANLLTAENVCSWIQVIFDAIHISQKTESPLAVNKFIGTKRWWSRFRFYSCCGHCCRWEFYWRFVIGFLENVWRISNVLFFFILGRGADSKLNNSILKHWAEVLRRYVNKIADRELQLLFAVQILVTKRQHAKGSFFRIIWWNANLALLKYFMQVSFKESLRRSTKVA